jgi:hypothetical protein
MELQSQELPEESELLLKHAQRLNEHFRLRYQKLLGGLDFFFFLGSKIVETLHKKTLILVLQNFGEGSKRCWMCCWWSTEKSSKRETCGGSNWN